jgi:hypothetical protein
MNTKLLAVIALGTFAVSAIPAAASFNQPLSPAGGQRADNNGPSINSDGTFGGQSQNLVYSDGYGSAATYEDHKSGSLSRSGSDR